MTAPVTSPEQLPSTPATLALARDRYEHHASIWADPEFQKEIPAGLEQTEPGGIQASRSLLPHLDDAALLLVFDYISVTLSNQALGRLGDGDIHSMLTLGAISQAYSHMVATVGAGISFPA